MKCLPIYVLFLACLIVKGNSEAIQCYQCDDCGALSDSQLVSCPAPPAETTTTTEAPATITPTDAPTTVTTTEAPTTTTTTTTTTEPSTTPTTTTELPTTTTALPTTTTVGEPSRNKALPDVKIPGVVSILGNSRSQRSLRSILRAEPTYECYSLDKVDGDKRKVVKGCVEVPDTKDACETIKGQIDGKTENCSSCKTDKCNSSATLKLSLATFLIALMMAVIYK